MPKNFTGIALVGQDFNPRQGYLRGNGWCGGQDDKKKER
jgi:hypothetical protein